MDSERDELERDLKSFQKSVGAMDGALCGDAPEEATAVSLRRENLKFYEFCLRHDIEAGDKNGGWSPSEHRTFAAVVAQFGELSFSKLFPKLKLHFAGKQKAAIQRHHEWHRLYSQHIATNQRMRTQKRVTTKLLAKRARSDQLVRDGMHRLSARERSEQEAFASKVADLRQRTEDIGRIRSDRQREREQAEREQMELERAERARREAEWNEYRSGNKERLDGYRRARTAQFEAVEAEEERQRALDRAKQSEISKANAKRVEFREEKYTEKMDKLREAQSERAHAESMKEHRLSRLRRSVQQQLDYEKIQGLSGVTNETESTRRRAGSGDDGGYREGVVDMFPDHGYSDQQLFREPKFELMNRLIASNLHRSKYAKEALKKTGALSAPQRKDCGHSAIF